MRTLPSNAAARVRARLREAGGARSADSEGGPSAKADGDTDAMPAERIVACWCDASGRWPARGFFSAISAVSDTPEAAYVAASEQGDLSLGDVHLVPYVASLPSIM